LSVFDEDIKDLREKVHAIDKSFSAHQSKKETERVWLAIVGLLIVAWLGVESYFEIPARINDEINERIASDTHLSALKSIEAERSRLISAQNEMKQFVQVISPATITVVDVKSTNGYDYFKFETELIDTALGGDAWDRSILSSYNHRTGRVRPVWLWRERRDKFGAPGSHGRYVFKDHADAGDWQENDTVSLFIGTFKISEDEEE